MQITGWEMWLALGVGLSLGAWSDRRKHKKRGSAPTAWTLGMRWFATIAGIVWLVIFVILLNRIPNQGWRNDFLTFIPANEIGAPHTAKWLVETCAGDGGWATSSDLPGTLTATTVVQWVNANISWQLNGEDYAFRIHNTGHALLLTPTSSVTRTCVASDPNW